MVHNFKREASKKEGGVGGGIYMERPKPNEHFFGTSEDSKVLPNVGKALNTPLNAVTTRRTRGTDANSPG